LAAPPFTTKGLEKAVRDRKSEKTGKWFDIGMWVIIAILVLNGIITQDALVKMIAGTGTSKAVRFLVR
jgi:hypothetical protein